MDSVPDENLMKVAMTHWVFSPLAGAIFSDWTKVLREYGEHIPPRYWLRVMFTTIMSVMNSAINIYEQKSILLYWNR